MQDYLNSILLYEVDLISNEVSNEHMKLQVDLLDNRTSLKVNIFLKQFRISHSEIIQILRDGRSSEIGAEKLRGLLKLLPQPEEVRRRSHLTFFRIGQLANGHMCSTGYQHICC